MPMLQTPDLRLFAATFPGSESEQWFDRFLITTVEDVKVVDIMIKKNILDFNRSASPQGAFETLDVWLGESAALVEVIPSQDDVIHIEGMQANRECVEVASVTAHFAVCSAPASEYFDHFQWPLAIKYAHLDLFFFYVERRPGFVDGILPELWGLAPLSDLTRTFIKKPSGQGEKPELRGAEDCHNGAAAQTF